MEKFYKLYEQRTFLSKYTKIIRPYEESLGKYVEELSKYLFLSMFIFVISSVEYLKKLFSGIFAANIGNNYLNFS